MAKGLRVVLDTNTVLLALLSANGRLVPLCTTWQSGGLKPLLCAQTVAELLRVLAVHPRVPLIASISADGYISVNASDRVQ